MVFETEIEGDILLEHGGNRDANDDDLTGRIKNSVCNQINAPSDIDGNFIVFFLLFYFIFYFFIVVVHLSILPAQTKPFQFRCAMRIKFIILVMGRQCNSILSVVSSQCRDAPFLPTLGSISLCLCLSLPLDHSDSTKKTQPN